MAKLFSKEKDIFLKIINSILIIWFIIAIVITLGVGIHLINREEVLTYEQYKIEKCDLDKIPKEEIDKDTINDHLFYNSVPCAKKMFSLNKYLKVNFYILFILYYILF
jgi:hypothetical protein